jgi:hypothetical protein
VYCTKGGLRGKELFTQAGRAATQSGVIFGLKAFVFLSGLTLLFSIGFFMMIGTFVRPQK